MHSPVLDAVSACKGKDHSSSEHLCHEKEGVPLQALPCSPPPCLTLQVTLVHLYQAGMFADLDQIDAAPRIAASAAGDQSQSSASWTGIKVSAAEAPLKEEVQHKLQQLPPGVFDKCQQVIA